MSSRSPERIDPLRFGQQGRVLDGRFDLAQLPRLAGLLANDGGHVEYNLAFGLDGRNRPLVRTRVKADLRLTCQRCLEPVEHCMDSQSTLVLVTGLDEAGELSEEYESLMLEEPTVGVRDLVEEEILLGIPAFPRHDTPCGRGDEDAPADGNSHPESPFGALAALKKGKE